MDAYTLTFTQGPRVLTVQGGNAEHPAAVLARVARQGRLVRLPWDHVHMQDNARDWSRLYTRAEIEAMNLPGGFE